MGNHTQGKSKQMYSQILDRRELVGGDGSTLFYGGHMDAGEQCKDNFDRAESLWNGADGIPTEQAVKAIEHYEEMKRRLIGHCFSCRFHDQEPYAPPKEACDKVVCDLKGLLRKLEVEG